MYTSPRESSNCKYTSLSKESKDCALWARGLGQSPPGGSGQRPLTFDYIRLWHLRNFCLDWGTGDSSPREVERIVTVM